MAVSLPLAGTAERFDASEHEPPLDGADAIDEQDAVEVIHLVLDGAGEKAVGVDDALAAVAVEAADREGFGTADGGMKAGDAEAAFFDELHAFTSHEFRIDEDDALAGYPADGEIDHEDPIRRADLRRRETDAGGRVDGVEHVVDQREDVGREGLRVRGNRDTCRALMQDWGAVAEDRANQTYSPLGVGANTANRWRTRARVWA